MAGKSGTSTPAISLPKGGGAIKGIGETFQPNLFTGTGNFSIPIYTSPGRTDFGPKLTLQYSTGNGNGPFGLGWQLSVPRITRKTEKGLPTYTDKDVFVMSGAEDLVPNLDKNGNLINVPDQGNYSIMRYRPRTEGLFAKIEKWFNKSDKRDVFWRVITKENITSIYGKSPAAKIADPDKLHHIYEWLLEETFDAKGNHILYEYVQENPNMVIKEIYEENRRYTQAYLRRILYGNTPDNLNATKKAGPEKTATDHNDLTGTFARHYMFEVLFDYGDFSTTPDVPFNRLEFPEKIHPEEWPRREDSFSSFRSGFEIRTLRRCERVLMLNHFKEGELTDAPLVKSTDFTYEHNKDTKISFLTAAKITGYRRQGNAYRTADMPSVTFTYSEFKPHQQRYQSVTANGNDLPSRALNDANFALFDLFGNSLPDILNTTDFGYRYWQNLGYGHIDRRHPQEAHCAIPAGITLSDANVAVGDMGGDGLPDLIVETPEISGFYEATPDGKWRSFKKFKNFPNLSIFDPNVRLLDLTGDGLSDVLVTRDDFFLWYKCLGEKGYDEPDAVPREHNLNEFPDVYFNDPAGRVRLADMTGDGLKDIVLMHEGRIDYWPNLGYGKFGKRITMGTPPKVGLEYNFDPKRLFLVDIDGTGCADLVYIDFGCVHFWFNQSGNCWSDKQTINGTPLVSDVSSVQFADFYGSGTACIVWSYDYNFQPDGNYKVLDFCGGVKPYLLTEMSNNMGATTRVQYASSTKFYLEDKEKGQPWVTNLPFPVQVLEKTEVIDHVSKTKLVTKYKYHHGYYDGREREFRGFGRVDQFDTEKFDDFTQHSLHVGNNLFENNNKAFHVPTIETRTWFHSGVYFDEDNVSPSGEFYDHKDLMKAYSYEFYNEDSNAFRLNYHEIEENDTPHEAYRALRGAILHAEVYALDGTEKEKHPYVVTDIRYKIIQIQPMDSNNHAVYLTTQKESISYHYERNPDDPRIGHELILSIDDYGNVTDKASISYPRRIVLADMPEQGELRVLYTKTDFINKPSQAAFYYVGIPCQVRSFEITSLPSGRMLRETDFQSVVTDFKPLQADLSKFEHYLWERTSSDTGIKKRIVEWTRSYFRKNKDPDKIDAPGNVTHRLDLGEIESIGLPYENYQAAFNKDMLNTVYGNLITGVDLADEGGYHKEPEPQLTDYWWIPSGRQSFNENKFYLSEEIQDPFGNISYSTYDDYALLMETSIDAVGNVIKAENDYRVLQPFRIKDPNDNYSQVAFDTLGMVAGTAVWGKDSANNTVGDSLKNFVADLDPAVIKNHLDDPLNLNTTHDTNPHNILQKATTRLVYDLKRFRDSGQPNVVYTLARKTHVSDENGTPTKIQHSFLYSDGFGREAQTRIQAEPGLIYDTDGNEVMNNVNPRWVGTGTRIYNNKGKPVREFEPFFSNTHLFGIQQYGVSPVLFYDPLERVVCTIHPNYTYEEVVFDPWKQETWDVNDTVLFRPDSDNDIKGYVLEYLNSLSTPYETWYERNNNSTDLAQKDAAQKTREHAGTSTLAYLDSLGRPFLTIQDNGPGADNKFRTRVKLDIEGNDLVITDPRNIDAFIHVFDIAGRKLKVESKDADIKYMLPDITGERPVYSWDANGNIVKTLYDELRRSIETRVKIKSETNFYLAEKTIYGESPPGISNPKKFHLWGQVWKIYDGAGQVTNNEYDFKGNLLSTSRRLLNDGKIQVRWPLTSNNFDYAQAETFMTPVSESYILSTEYDALNRVTSNEMPDGTIYKPAYNEANMLESLVIIRRGASTTYVKNIDYNEKGQRTKIEYNNDVTTDYTYEPDTYRLSTIITRRKGSLQPKVLQNIKYTCDPIGNITQIRNDAHPLVFNNNTIVEPVSRYTYDAVYRLIEATGREHESMTACHYRTKDKKHTEFIPYPQPISNAQAICRYNEKYSYDKSGNIKLIDHHNITRDTCWKRNQNYMVDDPTLPVAQQIPINNRLVTSKAGCTREDTFNYPHDENGNITELPHLPELKWDFKNQLIEVQLNVGANPDKAYYQYNATGQRVRKYIVKNNGAFIEERIYLVGYEIYIERTGSGPQFRRDTIHVMDDKNRIALIEEQKDPSTLQVQNTRVRYQISNHLDSSILELDDSLNAEIISYEEYYPYGGTAYIAGRNWDETKLKRYRYSGKERDDETGLYYYGARYYAPWMGRWISCDPIGIKGGMNLYAFVKNNSINKSDKNGLDDEKSKQTGSNIQQSSENPIINIYVTDQLTVNLSASNIKGVTLEGFSKETGLTYSEEYPNVMKLRTEFKPIPGSGKKGYAVIESKFNTKTGQFYGAEEPIKTFGDTAKKGVARMTRSEHYSIFQELHNARISEIKLFVIESDTVAEMTKGIRFEETRIGRHMIQSLKRVGLKLDAVHTERLGYGYGVRANVRPTITPKGAVLTGTGIALSVFGLIMTKKAIDEAYEESIRQEDIKPLKDETIRQGAAWGAGLTIGFILGEILGGGVGGFILIAAASIGTGNLAYHGADEFIKAHDKPFMIPPHNGPFICKMECHK